MMDWEERVIDKIIVVLVCGFSLFLIATTCFIVEYIIYPEKYNKVVYINENNQQT